MNHRVAHRGPTIESGDSEFKHAVVLRLLDLMEASGAASPYDIPLRMIGTRTAVDRAIREKILR